MAPFAYLFVSCVHMLEKKGCIMPVASTSPNKHIVPTHLNLPDQVLTLWSCSLTARQLLLVLVGSGLAGDLWQTLHLLAPLALAGQVLRGLLALLPLLVALFVAWYRFHGRYLEGWAIVLARYWLRPRCFVWRSLRAMPDATPRARLQRAETAVRRTTVVPAMPIHRTRTEFVRPSPQSRREGVV